MKSKIGVFNNKSLRWITFPWYHRPRQLYSKVWSFLRLYTNLILPVLLLDSYHLYFFKLLVFLVHKLSWFSQVLHQFLYQHCLSSLHLHFLWCCFFFWEEVLKVLISKHFFHLLEVSSHQRQAQEHLFAILSIFVADFQPYQYDYLIGKLYQFKNIGSFKKYFCLYVFNINILLYIYISLFKLFILALT